MLTLADCRIRRTTTSSASVTLTTTSPRVTYPVQPPAGSESEAAVVWTPGPLAESKVSESRKDIPTSLKQCA